VILSRQIATLFEAQVSALRIFRLLGAENSNKKLQKILNDVSNDLQGGSSISRALSRHPDVFSDFYVSMVRSGEESGTLEKTFNYLADYLDRMYQVVSRARNALIYPAFVIAVFFGVMTLMLTLVIPSISQILVDSGQEIPIYTKIVIAISDFVSGYIGLLIVLGVLFGIVLWQFKKTEAGQRTIDEFKLSIPGIGNLYEKLFLTRICDNLATMLSSGISMIQALEVTAEVVDNAVYREIIENVIVEVKGGRSFADAIAEYPEIPGVLAQMSKVGEETGKLGEILETLSTYYRREVNNAVDTLIGLIEPAMIVLLGLGVGVLLASVLMPIYNITATI
jgi:type IV pilus assembly protein PilC